MTVFFLFFVFVKRERTKKEYRMDIKDIGNIGISLAAVMRLSGGKFLIEYAAAGSVVSETWDIEEPEQLLFTPAGVLVYVNNHGEVEEIISASALIRVKQVTA